MASLIRSPLIRQSADGPKTARSRPRPRKVPPLRGLVPLVGVMLIWEVVKHEEWTVYGPPPSQWLAAVTLLWQKHLLQSALIATFQTFALSLLVATVTGTVLGALVGRIRFADRLLGPLLEYCRVMPAAAVVPLAVLFAGYTQSMKVSVVVFTAIWPILLQVRSAARGLDPILFDVGKALHLGRLGTLRKILVPSIVPAVLLGVRVAAPTVLIIVLLVEIVTGITGVGSLIEQAQQDYVSARVYGLVTMAGVLALLVNGAVASVEGYLLRYRPQAH